ncbi:FkbM family methyltransferase [Yoonia vestfoldensis]|uniref:FkbM family methyltransferase n=1 Tax=Yoonia vestfoldensis TaxID=245188 RepID=UPI0012FF8F03|nr:FkbM family methyltransferase [Yoonia vestfoldensis]
MRYPLSRMALKHGVAPSFEHFEILQGLNNIKCLVDVGANVGQFSLLCKIVHPNAHIHAFEPLNKAADTYLDVLGHESGVQLYRHAIGSQATNQLINVTAKSDSSSLLAPDAQSRIFPGSHVVSQKAVCVLPLQDVLCEEDIVSPALLKIDVQGFEGEVLKGSERLLDSFDWIYCEASFIELYSGQALADEIIAWLSIRGWKLVSVTCDRSVLYQGRTIQGDFLFKRNHVSN